MRPRDSRSADSPSTPQGNDRRHVRRGVRPFLAVTFACCTIALGITVPTTSVSAATTADTCVPSSASGTWPVAVANAKAALTGVVSSIENRNFGAAVTRLKTLKQQIRIAHTDATSLIGLPPTDPESDDPPGVKAVLRVGDLEHQVTMQLVPLFDNLHNGDVVPPLGVTLNVAVACRDVMLAKVIGLRPGQRDAYTDGLSDTLPDYKKELTLLTTALTNYDLSAGGREALKAAKEVVTATRDEMKRVFGGGE